MRTAYSVRYLAQCYDHAPCLSTSYAICPTVVPSCVVSLPLPLPGCTRQVVSRDIRRILTERARFFNLVLDDVSITHLTFSKVYEAAIEAKQVCCFAVLLCNQSSPIKDCWSLCAS